MRIRKNARLIVGGSSPSSSSSKRPSASSLSASFLVCQLNRSPWDVIDPSSLQGDEFGLSNNNGSCYIPHSITASDSHPSGESMELSFEYVEKPPPPPPEREDEFRGMEEDGNGNGRGFGVVIKAPQPIPAPRPPPSLPKKRAPSTPLPLPPPCPPPAPKKRGRPRKHPAAAAPPAPPTSNPYEFYYYSGFGPKWGKSRRGGDRSTSANSSPAVNTASAAAIAAKDIDNYILEDEDVVGVMECTPGSSSTTQMMSDDEDDRHFHRNNNSQKSTKSNKMKKSSRKDNGVDMLDNVVDGELDYIYSDSDDNDKDERELYGGARGARKPIKARSLKSLM